MNNNHANHSSNQNQNNDMVFQYQYVKSLEKELIKLKNHSIISIVLSLILIGIIVAMVLVIIDSIKILSTDWFFWDINNQKIMWTVLSLVILGPIGILVFAYSSLSKVRNKLNLYENSIN